MCRGTFHISDSVGCVILWRVMVSASVAACYLFQLLFFQFRACFIPVFCGFFRFFCFLMWFVHRLLLRLSESVKIDVSYIAPYIAVACVPCHNRFLCAVPENRLRPIRVLGYIPEIKGKPVQQLRFDIAGSVANTAGASD